jgi:hypothetical protein
MVVMRKLATVTMILGLGLLVACSSESSQPEKPQPKPPEFVTGRTAFQKLYIAARGWARDAQPFLLESQGTAESNGQDGTAAVWRAAFASSSERKVKPYMWTGVDAKDAPARGISPGSEDTYNPSNSSTQIFDLAFLKVDSDKALQVANEHGGDKLLKKEPATPILYGLEWNAATNELVWHVYYGPNRDEAKLKVDVNASTGGFNRVVK